MVLLWLALEEEMDSATIVDFPRFDNAFVADNDRGVDVENLETVGINKPADAEVEVVEKKVLENSLNLQSNMEKLCKWPARFDRVKTVYGNINAASSASIVAVIIVDEFSTVIVRIK